MKQTELIKLYCTVYSNHSIIEEKCNVEATTTSPNLRMRSVSQHISLGLAKGGRLAGTFIILSGTITRAFSGFAKLSGLPQTSE